MKNLYLATVAGGEAAVRRASGCDGRGGHGRGEGRARRGARRGEWPLRRAGGRAPEWGVAACWASTAAARGRRGEGRARPRRGADAGRSARDGGQTARRRAAGAAAGRRRERRECERRERRRKKNARTVYFLTLPSVLVSTLGKDSLNILCRVSHRGHSAKAALPSVICGHSANYFFIFPTKIFVVCSYTI